MFRLFVIGAAGFAIAGAAAYALVFFGTLAVWQMLGVVDRDGGGSMGLAFVIAPAVAVLVGMAGAIVAVRRAYRSGQSMPAGVDDRRRDVSRFALLAGVVAGALAGYFAAKFAFWLAGPIRYDAMWKAMVHAWAPAVATILGALSGWLTARRMFAS